MEIQELIDAAKDAVGSGDIERAKELTEQARTLQDIESLTPEESGELDAVKAERDALQAQVDEPATSKAGRPVVTEDEADKAKQLEDVGRRIDVLHHESLINWPRHIHQSQPNQVCPCRKPEPRGKAHYEEKRYGNRL